MEGMILLGIGVIIGLILGVISLVVSLRYQAPTRRTIKELETKYANQRGKILEMENQEVQGWIDKLPKENE